MDLYLKICAFVYIQVINRAPDSPMTLEKKHVQPFWGKV